MRLRIALLALGLLAAAPAAKAALWSDPFFMGSAVAAAGSASLHVTTTKFCPANSTIQAEVVNTGSTGGGAPLVVDNMPSCQLTATETSTVLTVTGFGTCGTGGTIPTSATLSGNSFAGTITVAAPGCILVTPLPATCSVSGGATVASPALVTLSGYSNTYQAGGGGVTFAAVARFTPMATTSPEQPTNFGLANSSTVSVTYGSSTTPQITSLTCNPGFQYWRGNADNLVATPNNTATSANPNLTLTGVTMKAAYDLIFVFTLYPVADTYTESAGFTTADKTCGAASCLATSFAYITPTTLINFSATLAPAGQWQTVGRAYVIESCVQQGACQ